MILRLTTMYENGEPPLSPLGERVAHDGAFISRRGPGEGVPIFMAARNLALVSACNGKNQGEIPRCARNDSSGRVRPSIKLGHYRALDAPPCDLV